MVMLLMSLHVDSKYQNINFNDASFDKFDFNNEKFHCTPIDLMIHNFLEGPKLIVMKILYILLPQINIFTF